MKKSILVRGPALSRSGYGEQTRFALRSLRAFPDRFDVFLINTGWGQTGWLFDDDEERRWIDTLLKKTIFHQQKKLSFDMSLQITIPNEWEKLAPVNIGYTAGIETTKVSPQWVEKSFLMDKIIVISEHAKQTYQGTTCFAQDQKSGQEIQVRVRTPIDVVNYPVRSYEPTPIELGLETEFNFLSMSQWGPRKNLDNTIRWFLEEFQNDDDVGLVLKSFLKNNSTIDKSHMMDGLKKILKDFPDRKCKLYLVHGDMTDSELTSLYTHSKVKAFISLAHGEGFGLSLFEAAYNSLPVVAPAWSGYCDYMYMPVKNKKGKIKKRAQFAKVDYNIQPIQDSAVWKGVLEKDSMWCYPQQNSYKHSLREVYKNYGRFKSQAKKLKGWIEENFTPEKQHRMFADSVYKPDEKLEQWNKKINELEEL